MYIDKKMTVLWICSYCFDYVGDQAIIDTGIAPKHFIPPRKNPKCPVCGQNKHMTAFEATKVGKVLPDSKDTTRAKIAALKHGCYSAPAIYLGLEQLINYK